MTTAITFDTLRFVETLKKSGIPENQAKAISKAFAHAHDDAKLATKNDILAVKTEIKDLRTELKGDMKELEYRLIIKMGAMIGLAVGLIVTLGKIL